MNMARRMESGAAENCLFEAIMCIAAHDQQARLHFLCREEERMAYSFVPDRSLGRNPNYRYRNLQAGPRFFVYTRRQPPCSVLVKPSPNTIIPNVEIGGAELARPKEL